MFTYKRGKENDGRRAKEVSEVVEMFCLHCGDGGYMGQTAVNSLNCTLEMSTCYSNLHLNSGFKKKSISGG